MEELRPQAHGGLLGRQPALLLAPQRRSQVGVGLLGDAFGDQPGSPLLPSLGALQPQDADRVDQFGQRARGDRLAEPVVGVDRATQPAERCGRDAGLARHRPELARHGDRRPALRQFVAHLDGELDRAAQIAVLDRRRLGHAITIATVRRRRTGVLDSVRVFVLTCRR